MYPANTGTEKTNPQHSQVILEAFAGSTYVAMVSLPRP
jgi:hypothetical protein